MWRFESVHGFASVGNLYQKMHFVGSNLTTGSKSLKCIYKISKNFRVEKNGEISRNLRFSLVFVPASKSDTHHGRGGRFRTTKCRSFLVADLTARLFSSRYGYPLAMMGADSIRYLPGYQRHACKLNLCRRELTHLRRGDFSTDSTDYGTQMTGRSSR